MSSNIAPIIEIRDLSTYLDGLWVHQHLSLSIYANRTVTLIGASGCGKTTLVRQILRLQDITQGEIYVAGEKISHYNINDPATKFKLSKIGMMFQHGALFSSLSVLENVMFPLREYTRFSLSAITEIASLKLKLAGLEESAYKKYPQEISGGMRKRVALARTLALDPQIVFLDEPTAGLDPASASSFDELISDLQQQLSLTVIMVTHDLESIWNISDELIYMGDKKILFHDTVQRAAQETNIPELYTYFNGTRGQATKAFYLN